MSKVKFDGDNEFSVNTYYVILLLINFRNQMSEIQMRRYVYDDIYLKFGFLVNSKEDITKICKERIL